jgi:hypothetical protein
MFIEYHVGFVALILLPPKVYVVAEADLGA